MEELMNTESTVITYTNYGQYKAALDAELQKSAEGFVKIGYLLKVARDTRILEDSGYANVNEFAEKEYGLDKTQVSRFIRINDRFSEDGYSENLKLEYKGYGYAKLALMLMLPDAINEELTADYSKSEIQAIKEEVDAEQKISDLEVMMEEKDEVQQSLDDTLAQVVYQLGKEDPKLYCDLWESQMERQEDVRGFMEIFAPSGTKTYSVRIPGKGRMMLMIREDKDELKLINVRDETDKRTYTKQDIVDAFRSIFEVGSAKESWSSTYGEEYPEEKEEVAPVQPVRKESKVVKAKEPEKKEKPKKAETHEEETKKENPAVQQSPEAETEERTETENAPEQQLPGQDNIMNHPEYMPDSVQETQEKLQEKAKKIVEMSLIVSMDIWSGKKMPLDVIRRNKDNAQRVVELFEKMEKLTGSGEENA